MTASPEIGTRFDDFEKVIIHEKAANEIHRWVRLTHCCNNHCAFCLDEKAQNGTFVPRQQVRRQIIDGRLKSATRLILSGGEPTIHPGFVEFVRLGRDLGYAKIQTVTNGRMFSYPGFLRKCLDAGLSEITFSIHGHDAATHDALVGVAGAFDQAVAALGAALADGRPVVNIDVCLNRVNIRTLPRLMERFIALGVREFDLLHLIPFGRAYEKNREMLFYDIDEAMPAIRHALRLSEQPDLHVWFNRFPAPYLEGHEHLIQDPRKLEDEVNGRREEFERLLADGSELSCRQPDRCRLCYLQQLCDALDETRRKMAGGGFRFLRIHVEGPGAVIPAPVGSFVGSWICAENVENVSSIAGELPGQELVLELGNYDRVSALLGREPFASRRLLRAYASRPVDIALLLSTPGDFEVFAYLTRDVAGYILETFPRGAPRLTVCGKNHARLTEAAELDADLEDFFSRHSADVRVENVPACISGRLPRPPLDVLDASALDARGRLDIFGHTRRFVLDRYYTRSHRCCDCVHADACPGAHINYVRAHGYRTLQPVTGKSPACT